MRVRCCLAYCRLRHLTRRARDVVDLPLGICKSVSPFTEVEYHFSAKEFITVRLWGTSLVSVRRMPLRRPREWFMGLSCMPLLVG